MRKHAPENQRGMLILSLIQKIVSSYGLGKILTGITIWSCNKIVEHVDNDRWMESPGRVAPRPAAFGWDRW